MSAPKRWVHPVDCEYPTPAPLLPRPAWEEINNLFEKHGLRPPPTRLRDELVMHLLSHRAMSRAHSLGAGTGHGTVSTMADSGTPSNPEQIL